MILESTCGWSVTSGALDVDQRWRNCSQFFFLNEITYRRKSVEWNILSSKMENVKTRRRCIRLYFTYFFLKMKNRIPLKINFNWHVEQFALNRKKKKRSKITISCRTRVHFNTRLSETVTETTATTKWTASKFNSEMGAYPIYTHRAQQQRSNERNVDVERYQSTSKSDNVRLKTHYDLIQNDKK